MFKVFIFLTSIIMFLNSAPITVSPVKVPDELTGLYKATSFVLRYNGTNYIYNEYDLEGTYMMLGKDGTYSSTALINGTMATTFGYITNYTSSSVTYTNILDGTSITESYQFSNNILTMSSSGLNTSYTMTAKKVLQVATQPSNNSNITMTYLNSLSSGWTLIGTQSSITDLTVFNNVQIIWIHHNGIWSAYSSIASINQNILNANIPIISAIPENNGIWILK